MELLQLTYFCDAAETENLSRTAQKFQVPPSNISQSIKRLESELSIKLFNRSANRVMLNEQGKAFYQKVNAALSLINDAIAQIQDDEETGTINLLVHTNRRIVMHAIEEYRQKFPKVNVLTFHTMQSDLSQFHLIIADETLSVTHLKSQPLLSEPIYLAVSCDNPLSRQNKLTHQDLHEQPFINMSPGNSLHQVTMDTCHKWGFHPKIAIQSDDPFYIRKCIELNLGISLIPAISWRGQISDQICLFPIEGLQRTTCLYWDDYKCLPKCSKEFISILDEAFKKEASPDTSESFLSKHFVCAVSKV